MRRPLRFSKYTSFGNTFLVVDETRDRCRDDDQRATFARWALNRDFGIGGADNVLYLRPAGRSDRSADGRQADFVFRIFEYDGSETLSCGNGLLSTAAHLHRTTGACEWDVLTELPSGRPRLVRLGADRSSGGTRVDVGWPRPVSTELYRRRGREPSSAIDEVPALKIDLPGHEEWAAGLDETVELSGLLTFTGEPHMVLFEGHGLPTTLAERIWIDVDRDCGSRIGLPDTPQMAASCRLVHHIGMQVNQRYRDLFPQGVHLNFARLREREGVVEYRTWERAINCETLACGSGIVATAHVGRTYGILEGSDLTFWPHRCRWYQPDANLTVCRTEQGFVLSGRPKLVMEGSATGNPLSSVAIRPAGRDGADLADSLRGLGLDVRPLRRAEGASPPVLQESVKGRQATLFRGLVDPKSLRDWTPSSLRARLGDKVVTAHIGLPSTGVLFPKDQRRYERTLAFGDFVETMLSAPPDAPCYLAYQEAEEFLPDGGHDFAGLLGGLDRQPDTRTWIGSAGTRSMLHSDLKDNLFYQLWGEKHVVLIPWEDSLATYPFPDNIVNSQLDLADLDLNRHPRLRDTVLYAGIVQPGDVLFIPAGWWHDIRSKTPSVSLNHWFGPPLDLRDYLPLIAKLGPSCWYATARDFVRNGLLGREETVRFFFSPPSTGRRIFDALRWGDFSRENDPSK